MVFNRCASVELQFGAHLGGDDTREAGGTVAKSLVGRSSALSGRYAPDSARDEGSSIVDKPGEC